MVIKEKVDYRVIIVVVICITAIEIALILKGMNGTMALVMASILATLGGLSLPQLIKFTK